MLAVASLPSSITAGPNAASGPGLGGNAPDLEKEMNAEERGGLHFLRRVTGGLFSSLISTMNILLLRSHPSIRVGEKRGRVHTPHFTGCFFLTPLTSSSVSCLPDLNQSDTPAAASLTAINTPITAN